jgi:hypothetical protein
LPPSVVAGASAVGSALRAAVSAIDHVVRLLLAVEVGVISERRRVVTDVVRRDDDVAFRREHRAIRTASVLLEDSRSARL